MSRQGRVEQGDWRIVETEMWQDRRQVVNSFTLLW